MKVNVGTVDRLLRIIAGIILIALAAMGTIGIWGYVGIVLVVTGLVRICPAYAILGMNTCGLKKS
jgi:hypothetical protein